MSKFFIIVQRDLHLALRQGMDSLMIVAFFAIAVVLFPFGIGPEPNILARIAPGIIWVAALLSSMLSLERLFQSDFDDGSLELLALQPVALELTVIAKVFVHWLTTGIPLIIIAPFLALMMNLPEEGLWSLIIALCLGTPSLSLIGAIGAALILGARRGGTLLSLLVLPLYIPVLIFGVSSVDAIINGFSNKPQFLILSGFLLAALALCPWASAAAVRQGLE
jgi:heme exporter protein B